MRLVLLSSEPRFPDPRRASRDGLLAIGGDFSVRRLLAAYSAGIFPWSANPITWWSPDPRGIIEFDRFHVSRSLARVLRRQEFQITVDQAFTAVMEGCAAPRGGDPDTWITPEFIQAYTTLHQAGHAHSVECWQESRLVGGIYGVAANGLFAAESMFHTTSNASKVALVFLVSLLRQHGFLLLDIQMVTPTTEQFGAVSIPRGEYLARLKAALRERPRFPQPGPLGAGTWLP